MLQFHSRDSGSRRSWLQVALVGVVMAGGGDAALAANHVISSNASTFECNSARPGDTLTLPAGTRGPLRIRNCNGTQSNPIVIRNDVNGSGPAVISRTATGTGGFVFNCENCTGIVIDGSQKWRGAPAGKTYGIKLTVAKSSSPSAFLEDRRTVALHHDSRHRDRRHLAETREVRERNPHQRPGGKSQFVTLDCGARAS